MATKLTEAEVENLRFLKRTGLSDKVLAFRFMVSESSISRYASDEKRNKARKSLRGRLNVKEQTCYKCGMLIDGHPRCSRCTILIHNDTDFCDSHQS